MKNQPPDNLEYAPPTRESDGGAVSAAARLGEELSALDPSLAAHVLAGDFKGEQQAMLRALEAAGHTDLFDRAMLGEFVGL